MTKKDTSLETGAFALSYPLLAGAGVAAVMGQNGKIVQGAALAGAAVSTTALASMALKNLSDTPDNTLSDEIENYGRIEKTPLIEKG